jgi:hypothetical protein
VTYRAIDEFKISRALRIAVPGPVLGTGLITRVLGHSSIGVHRDEIEGTIESALWAWSAGSALEFGDMYQSTEWVHGLTGNWDTSTSKAVRDRWLASPSLGKIRLSSSHVGVRGLGLAGPGSNSTNGRWPDAKVLGGHAPTSTKLKVLG